MATPGRGRGYSGRHHLRDARPGDEPEAVRTLAELSPHATAPLPDTMKPVKEPNLKDQEPTDLDDADPPEYNPSDDEAVMTKLLHIDEQYSPLLVLLEQFSPGEDGIQFNRKLRQFETTITNLCPDETRLIQVFAAFRAAALQNTALTRKLSGVGASFTRQQKQRALRAALLDVMQDTFAKLEVLERSNPLFLINAANLMGDYFAEARLCNGNKVHILASPLIQYMRALLSSDDIRAHRSLATQLMQNGRELLSVLPQELDDLSISIRLRLLSPPPVSIIWLLLSADLCLNRFLPLPNTLQQFYASHLELTADDNYSEVSYGSWKKSPEKDFPADTNQDLSDNVSLNVSQISLNENGEMKPKLRPILGAGAGLLRQEQTVVVGQDGYDTWTPKSLSKRYDLNSWRQEEEEKQEESPVFNPNVLPPTLPNFNVPPPTLNRFNYQETFPNYLQQGDGSYIQSQYPANNTNFAAQGDFVTQYTDRPTSTPERVNNETQQSCSRKTSFNAGSGDFIPQPGQTEAPVNKDKTANNKPVENWRREKSDLKEDVNKNKPRNWTRQRSNDDTTDGDEKFNATRASRESLPGNSRSRQSRRNSADKESGNSGKTPPRRHVSDVPRNHKYWDHDDRCDKDYNS